MLMVCCVGFCMMDTLCTKVGLCVYVRTPDGAFTIAPPAVIVFRFTFTGDDYLI